MRLKLASRKSDLARWQAVQVARALEQLPGKPSIEFLFKSSLGDQNLDLPLAGMGAKGVFTEDFYADLVSGQCDLVVHSWKDLPVEERSDTRIALTLKRADVRDVLLVPNKVWEEAGRTGQLSILTSSPRRIYNLQPVLGSLLPGGVKVTFEAVRGNVPTRLAKMHSQGRGLILAKAGLDRLIEAERQGFLSQESTVFSHLADCRFQVLPVSLNPPAPAQGALAVEVAAANALVNDLCLPLMDEMAFACVNKERAILRQYGGGCHQKIGVAVLPREYGTIYSVRGLTDQGEILNRWEVENATPWARAASPEQVFPLQGKANAWFDREPVWTSDAALRALHGELNEKSGLFVARADALPKGYVPRASQRIWAAGVQSWMKLAAQGVWVNGCQDGLGEHEAPAIEHLAGGAVQWTKLTHAAAASLDHQDHRSSTVVHSSGGHHENPCVSKIGTYRLVARENSPDLCRSTHFFWLSPSSFERAYQLFPQEIDAGYNACGPGVTYDFLKRKNGLKNPVKVFLGLEQFLRESLPNQ